MTTEPLRPKSTTHPGEILAEELDARGVTRRELALQMGRSLGTVNAICRSAHGVTPVSAVLLERALEGIPAVFWLNLQTQYDLARARRDLAGRAAS